MANRFSPQYDQHARQKIQTSQLINRLQNFALVEVDAPDFRKKEMTPLQVRAAIALIAKTIPDLAAVQVTGQVGVTNVREATDEELMNVAFGPAGGRKGTAGTSGSAKEPDPIH